MAAEQPRTQLQIPVLANGKCELCEENDVAWKCLVCDELMCNQCNISHVKSKLTKDHQVVSMVGAEKLQNKVKKVDVKCKHHPLEKIKRYCEECSLLVCITCIADGNHKNHTFCTIKDAIENKGKELSQMIEQFKQMLVRYQDTIPMMKKNQCESSNCISECIAQVETRNSKLKEEFDKLTNKFIRRLKALQRDTEKENTVQERLLSLKELVEKCEEKLQQQEPEIIQFVADVKQQLDEHNSCDHLDSIKFMYRYPEFICRNLYELTFHAIFGHLNFKSMKTDLTPTIDIEVIQILSVEQKNILASVSDEKIWMARQASSGASLVMINGDVVKTTTDGFWIQDLVVTKTGDVLATVMCKCNQVKKLMSDDSFRSIYYAPCYDWTQGITVTDNNNIIVCLHHEKRKESRFVELSSSGQEISSKMYQRQGENILKLSSNRNGDLIVIQNNTVVVLDKVYNKKFTYTGQTEGLVEPFIPQCAVTDKYGHILISDFNNHAIHILDKDGNFKQYIRTKTRGVRKPEGMCIDEKDRLWVSSKYSDKVMIIKYI